MTSKKTSVTINDIAKELGTSASTVSRALNNHPKISQATKDKVRQVAINLGYAQNTASNLRSEITSKTVGIIVPDLNQTKYSILVESARKKLEENGYQVLINCSSDSTEIEQSIINYLEHINIEGIIGSLTHQDKNPAYYYRFAEQKPLVLFDRVSFEMPCNKIMIDHFQAGFRAVQHLLNNGCKKIAHIGGNINCPLTKQISTGYKTAMRNGSIKVNPSLELFSDIILDDVMKAAEIIYSQKERPEAILVDDILAAQKLISILQTRKIRIPEDVAIIAIGDERDYSYYSPSITTIQLPFSKVGNKAAKMLINQLNNQDSFNKAELFVEPFNLNIRNSTLRN